MHVSTLKVGLAVTAQGTVQTIACFQNNKKDQSTNEDSPRSINMWPKFLIRGRATLYQIEELSKSNNWRLLHILQSRVGTPGDIANVLWNMTATTAQILHNQITTFPRGIQWFCRITDGADVPMDPSNIEWFKNSDFPLLVTERSEYDHCIQWMQHNILDFTEPAKRFEKVLEHDYSPAVHCIELIIKKLQLHVIS